MWCAGSASSSNWKVKHFLARGGIRLASLFQWLEVASVRGTAYLGRMSLTRLLRLLAIFAVILSPLSMASGHAAMAMPAASTTMADHMAPPAPAGHCADMPSQKDESGPPASNVDCLIACSTLPTLAFEVEAHPVLASFDEPAALVAALHGLHPESDPPPPRLS